MDIRAFASAAVLLVVVFLAVSKKAGIVVDAILATIVIGGWAIFLK